MNKKTTLILIFTFAICGILSTFGGMTYAYFYGRTDDNTGLQGNTFNTSSSIVVDAIVDGEMIPLKDSSLTSALTAANVCTDSRGYTACNLFKVTLSNSGIAQTFTGKIVTNSGTTFGNNVLKYQLLTKSGNTYTGASDIASLSTTVDNPFQLNSTAINFNLPDGQTTPYSVDYYLVIWLSDNNNDQPLTQNNHLNASLSFTSTLGDHIAAEFAS